MGKKTRGMFCIDRSSSSLTLCRSIPAHPLQLLNHKLLLGCISSFFGSLCYVHIHMYLLFGEQSQNNPPQFVRWNYRRHAQRRRTRMHDAIMYLCPVKVEQTDRQTDVSKVNKATKESQRKKETRLDRRSRRGRRQLSDVPFGQTQLC